MNNILISLGTILLGGVIFFLIRDFPRLDDGHPGPALFPGVLAGLFIVFGISLLVQSLWANLARNRIWKRVEGDLELNPPQVNEVGPLVPSKSFSFEGIINVLCVLASISFYIYFVETLGFLITGFLLLVLLMIKLGVPSWKSGVISLLSTLVIYMLFAKLLKVPLPWGLLGW